MGEDKLSKILRRVAHKRGLGRGGGGGGGGGGKGARLVKWQVGKAGGTRARR